jgi:hypothetical protein
MLYDSLTKLRERIFSRDNLTCQRCGATNKLVLHHVLPRRQGGLDTTDNLITLCGSCHTNLHIEMRMAEPQTLIVKQDIEDMFPGSGNYKFEIVVFPKEEFLVFGIIKDDKEECEASITFTKDQCASLIKSIKKAFIKWEKK